MTEPGDDEVAAEVRNRDGFRGLLGEYLVFWSTFELAVDSALWKLSEGTSDQSIHHMYRLQVSEKVKRVKHHLTRTGHPHSVRIAALLDRILADNIRNVFSHGVMRFGTQHFDVTMRRKATGLLVHRQFTRSSLARHISEMAGLAMEFESLTGYSRSDGEALHRALVNAVTSDRNSPV